MPIYRIADLVLKTNSFYDKVLNDTMHSYKINSSEAVDTDTAINVNLEYFDDTNNGINENKIPVPTENVISRYGISVYTLVNKCLTVSVCDFDINSVFAQIEFSESFTDVSIHLVKVSSELNISDAYFASNIFNIMFQILLQHYNGFIFHASSIMYNNLGIAFSAFSGTGKSTHTSIWQRVYPDTVMINDDAPAIRIINAQAYIYGTPWAGTTGINTNVKVPLRAFVFIERDSNNIIEELSTVDCLKRFFDQIRKPVTSENMNNVLNAFDIVKSKCGVYLLKCNMQDDAAITVNKFLFEKGKQEK